MPIFKTRLMWYAFASFIIALVTVMSGCAGTRSAREINRDLGERAAAHVYKQPLSQLRSLALVDSIVNDEVLVSAIQKTTFSDKEVQDLELDDLSSAKETDGRFQVTRRGVTYQSVKTDDGYRIEIYEDIDGKLVRQPEREWQYLKRVEPETAERLYAEVNGHN